MCEFVHETYKHKTCQHEEKKPEERDKLIFTSDKLRKFFPKSYTPEQMETTILRLLEQWQRKRHWDIER